MPLTSSLLEIKRSFYYSIVRFPASSPAFISEKANPDPHIQEAISTDHSTPTNVRAWMPESWHRRCVVHVVGVCCRVSLLLQDVFSGYSRFPLASKPNISKVQFDTKCLQLVGKPTAPQVYQFLEL